MKILLRKWNDKYYVWKDAIWRKGVFYVTEKEYGELEVYPVSILAIKDDSRKNHVVCANCGELIENTPAAIEKHFSDMEAKRDCFKCNSLSKNVVKSSSASFTKNEDGTYNVTENFDAVLKCRQSYYNSPSIDSEAAKKICIFHRCRKNGVTEINDVFIQYPDLFDKQVAVDVLIAKKFTCDGNVNNYFEYDLKCRNTVKACVNKLGIIDHFVIKCRGYRYNTYYSAKYDQLFFSSNGRDYTTDMPYNMTENKYTQAKAKISALYKEEESK